jgi:drug/metabolite transporter (DMT)-like permease
MYMGGAAVCWVAYGLLTRPLFERKRSRIYIVFWQNLIGFLGFIPFALLERGSWTLPSTYVFCHVIFLGLCCSAMGYWLYAHAMNVLGISVTVVFINLVPVITVIAGFFIMHDRLTLLQFAGAALVIGGVYLTVLPKRSDKKNKVEQV